MVDIAQLVSASDCGSEGRGFESHYPPHAKTLRFGGGFLHGVDNGIRKPGPGTAGVTNMPVACLLGRGRIHEKPTALRIGGLCHNPQRYRFVSQIGDIDLAACDIGTARDIFSAKIGWNP